MGIKMTMKGGFDTIEEAVKEIKKGRMAIVVDDEGRENEGDLVCAAQMATPEIINSMSKHGRGLICMPVTEKKARQLELEPMSTSKDRHGTAFTVSIDHRETATGISAHDRALTIQKAVAKNAKPADFYRPGHVFPLVAVSGGVLQRAGHTEAAVDLARLAGLEPAGVICEIMHEDGTMKRLPELMDFAKRQGLKIITIKDLIGYRLKREILVEQVSRARFPTKHGLFACYGYRDKVYGREYVALVKGGIGNGKDILVRVHSACLTGDALGSLRCDCGKQLDASLSRIAKEGRGVFLYIPHHEGRGIGLINKLRAYELQDMGHDTIEANEKLGLPMDLREYGLGAQILVDLGVKSMRLLTNNPRKIVGLEGYGITVSDRVPVTVRPNRHNQRYLSTKKRKMGHLLDI